MKIYYANKTLYLRKMYYVNENIMSSKMYYTNENTIFMKNVLYQQKICRTRKKIWHQTYILL